MTSHGNDSRPIPLRQTIKCRITAKRPSEEFRFDGRAAHALPLADQKHRATVFQHSRNHRPCLMTLYDPHLRQSVKLSLPSPKLRLRQIIRDDVDGSQDVPQRCRRDRRIPEVRRRQHARSPRPRQQFQFRLAVDRDVPPPLRIRQPPNEQRLDPESRNVIIHRQRNSPRPLVNIGRSDAGGDSPLGDLPAGRAQLRHTPRQPLRHPLAHPRPQRAKNRCNNAS